MNCERGSVLVEYALAASILVSVFVIVGILLQRTAMNNQARSIDVEKSGGAPYSEWQQNEYGQGIPKGMRY